MKPLAVTLPFWIYIVCSYMFAGMEIWSDSRSSMVSFVCCIGTFLSSYMAWKNWPMEER